MPAGCPESGDIPPRSAPGARAGTQRGKGKLESERGKDKTRFSGRISFHSKLTPIKRRTQVLRAG